MKRALRWSALAVLVLLLAAGAYLAALVPLTPDVKELQQAHAARPSVLLSADGKTLATFARAQQRAVTLEEVSPYVVQALLATEDRRFYEHGGVDLKRSMGALWNTLGGQTQGGSTITQQLARNLFPEEIGRSRTLHRKLKELVTALRIERTFSKRQILESYLNSAPFLYNVVGIEMAARTYYNKPASQLQPLEAATLIGMLKGTAYYNPVLHPERAQARRNIVLQQMVRAGALTEAQYRQLREQPVHVTFTRQGEDLGAAPHFAAYAKRWLIEWADQHDYNLYTDGLVVHSTIDSRLQEAATRAVQRQAAALQRVADVEWSSASPPAAYGNLGAYTGLRARAEPFRYFFASRPDLLNAFLRETPEYREALAKAGSEAAALQALKADAKLVARVRAEKTRLEAGFVAMSPSTGEVKAWVGSRDFDDDEFDHVALAARQPGSTFKPMVYGAALEMGIGPERTYADTPVALQLGDGTVWRPTDMHGSSGRMMSLREGLVYSKNTITAQVGQEVGIARVVALAQAMGVDRSKLDAVPSLVLGTSPVTLLEMANAYATIADQGTRRTPVFIRRIDNAQGEAVAEFASESRRALSPATCIELIDMLRGVVRQGTGTVVRTGYGISADVAGKTGTTQNNTDGWFMLMHPDLVAGAWVGFNDQRVTLRSDYWGQGGHSAVHLVGAFFRDALDHKLVDPQAAFPPPPHPPVPLVPPAPLPGDEWAQQDASAAPDGATPPADAGAPPVIEQAADGRGGVVIGDTAGVEAMRRSSAPAKSPEELERALSGLAARNGSTGASSPAPASASSASPPPPLPARPQPSAPAAEPPAAETAPADSGNEPPAATQAPADGGT